MSSWYAHGKLLLTGEYLVLEGALALALPLKFGQSFSVEKTSQNHVKWQANYLQKPWFSAEFSLPGLKLISFDNVKLAVKLQKILFQIHQMKPGFFSEKQGLSIKTELDFNPEFGFGSSSTLITNLSNWAGVNPYELQKITFGGSGFDIACALSGKPLFFQLIKGEPSVKEIEFKPAFRENIYFVYLGKKQKSLESIAHFKENAVFEKNDIEQISEISKQIIKAESLEKFENLLQKHELLLSGILKRETVKSLLFPDFPGTVKSLGGWGGDFVLMTFKGNKKELAAYLSTKNLETIFTYGELILA
ncbi:MAG TPA: GYDIA family GHMP kinase [Bacteroidales bacterium]